MRKFDKFLNKIFRKKTGLIALACATTLGAFSMSGCIGFDIAEWILEIGTAGIWYSFGYFAESCDGCDDCDQGFFGVSQCIDDSCYSPDCALSGILFGQGCVTDTDCGALWCAGFSSCDFDDCQGLRPGNCEGEFGFDVYGCGEPECSIVFPFCGFECGDKYDDQYFSKEWIEYGDDCSGCMAVPYLHHYDVNFFYYNAITNESMGTLKGNYIEKIRLLPTSYEGFDSDKYEFQGYYLDAGFTKPFADVEGKILDGKTIYEDIVLYGKIVEKYYGSERGIKFDLPEDCDPISPITVRVGNVLNNFPLAPERYGYEFKGWYNLSAYENMEGKEPLKVEAKNGDIFRIYDFTLKNEAEITLTAVYEKLEYDVKVVYGYNGESKEYVFDYDTPLKETLDGLMEEYVYDKTKCVFKGWTTVQYGEPMTSEESDLLKVEGDCTIYAVYVDYVTLTLKNYYGNGEDKLTVEEEDSFYTLPTGLTFQGALEFKGWFFDSQLTQEAPTSIRVDKVQTTFYAKWDPVTSYSLQYYLDPTNNNVSYSRTYEPNKGAVELINDVEADTGYSFSGWCLNSDLSDTPTLSLPNGTYGNKKLYAKFTPKTINVILIGRGGSVTPASVQLTYGKEYTLPVPTRTNYTFVGWYDTSGEKLTDEMGKSLAVLSVDTVPLLETLETVQFNATWTETKYEVKFYSEDGETLLSSGEYTSSQEVQVPTNAPAKKGHHFVGWYDASGKEKIETGAKLTSDKAYYAKYEANEYTITLMVDGVVYKTITVKYGQKVDLGTATKAGYEFGGWSDENGTPWAWANGMMIKAYELEGNITLYAEMYEIN